MKRVSWDDSKINPITDIEDAKQKINNSNYNIDKELIEFLDDYYSYLRPKKIGGNNDLL